MPPFWRPAPIFTGATVFCLAGGPSLLDFDFASLAGKRVIAVNEAIKAYPAADILYFWDDTWFVRNQALVHYRAGLTVTGSRMAAQQCERLRYIELQADREPGAIVHQGLVADEPCVIPEIQDVRGRIRLDRLVDRDDALAGEAGEIEVQQARAAGEAEDGGACEDRRGAPEWRHQTPPRTHNS
jgi:hypothetical protein